MTSSTRSPADDSTRPLLQTMPAPSRMGTLVTLNAPMGPGNHLTLAYVPDRLVLKRDSFAAYAADRKGQTLVPEALAAVVANDVANELVPKWQRITVATTVDGVAHTVVVEDRQPGWEHPSLLTAAAMPPMTKS